MITAIRGGTGTELGRNALRSAQPAGQQGSGDDSRAGEERDDHDEAMAVGDHRIARRDVGEDGDQTGHAEDGPDLAGHVEDSAAGAEPVRRSDALPAPSSDGIASPTPAPPSSWAGSRWVR